jgi:hypothetical protein
VFFIHPLDAPATGNEVDEYHDDRNDEQNVDKTAYGVAAHHAKQPEND